MSAKARTISIVLTMTVVTLVFFLVRSEVRRESCQNRVTISNPELPSGNIYRACRRDHTWSPS